MMNLKIFKCCIPFRIVKMNIFDCYQKSQKFFLSYLLTGKNISLMTYGSIKLNVYNKLCTFESRTNVSLLNADKQYFDRLKFVKVKRTVKKSKFCFEFFITSRP